MAWDVVAAALITAIGGIITTILMIFRKENTKDHARVVDALEMLSGNVQSIGTKLDGHIDWHLKGTTNGEVSSGNQSTRTQRHIKN